MTRESDREREPAQNGGSTVVTREDERRDTYEPPTPDANRSVPVSNTH